MMVIEIDFLMIIATGASGQQSLSYNASAAENHNIEKKQKNSMEKRWVLRFKIIANSIKDSKKVRSILREIF